MPISSRVRVRPGRRRRPFEEGLGLGEALVLGEDGAEVEVAEIARRVEALSGGELAEGVGVVLVLVELPEGDAEGEVGGGGGAVDGDGAVELGEGAGEVAGGVVGVGDLDVEEGSVAGERRSCWAVRLARSGRPAWRSAVMRARRRSGPGLSSRASDWRRESLARVHCCS